MAKHYCIDCQRETQPTASQSPRCDYCQNEYNKKQNGSIMGAMKPGNGQEYEPLVYKKNPFKDHPKKGIKNDSNFLEKPPLDLLTLEFLTGTARALGFGANKYGRHNFREGIDHSRLIAAALRHMNQYNAGTDQDAESGLSHLAHAAASLNMLMWMVENRPELDDRYKGDSKK